MAGNVIVAGARTPMGRLLGSLKGFSAADLGGFAIKAALERSGVSADQVDYVIMGHVLQAGTGQITARQAAVKAGIGMDVPALTINKVCLSGLDAIALADQLIRAGEYEIVVAGGMESMTNAPHLLMGSREGVKYGDWKVIDSLAFDGLTCAFDQCAMGESTEGYLSKYPAVTRERQDAFAARSHQLAAIAEKNGAFAEEIVPVEIPQRKGDPIVFATDEGVRADTTAESLGRLRAAFAKDGSITAGNASPLNDGASAVVLGSEAAAQMLGRDPQARIAGRAAHALDPQDFGLAPIEAANRALQRAGITWSDVGAVELNEAFAVQSLACIDAWGIDPEIVNNRGGAIAIGHPLGASGGRILGTLSARLQESGQRWGVAAICIGVGQGLAVVLENVA